MTKRIFRNMALTAILSVLLAAMLIVPLLYRVHEKEMSRELGQEAALIACGMQTATNDVAYLESLDTENRMTLISTEGVVLFDTAAEVDQMENHAERPEVLLALQHGSGESIRPSDTLAETTIYYALHTNDGYILRVAATRGSVLAAFVNVLPLICGMFFCVVLLALAFAKRTSQRIVEPINALNLDQPLENDAYDELAPLLSRMDRQHTQIMEQLKALENAHAKLAAIMDHMREGMILLDQNSVVLSMNQSAARIYGVPAETQVGRNLLSISRDANLHDLAVSALQGQSGALTIGRGDRRYRIYASPVVQKDAICGAVLLMLDVTEHFAAEESRREFTANVSHELKTPLTSISGFAEIIRDGIVQPQDIQHFAGMICKESARLIALVNDILELSQLDEKQNLGQKEHVPLMPMLRELMNDFSLASQSKSLTLHLSGDEAEVEGYPKLLREMFFNLMDNAVKYTPENGEVSITVQKEENRIVCRVSDTGIGIPKEHQSRVFERFYRVDKSHSRTTGGTGLGLAIVKHVTQIHGAQIDLISSEGEGTTFQLIFTKKS